MSVKKKYASRDIEIVSQYIFGAIFRSRSQFQIYTLGKEFDVCRKILILMSVSAIVGWFVVLIGYLEIMSVGWLLCVLFGSLLLKEYKQV